MASREQLATQRLRTALELTDIAEEMLAQRLRRKHPELSDEQLRKRIAAWYQDRPGAQHGDAEGTPGTWPRRR